MSVKYLPGISKYMLVTEKYVWNLLWISTVNKKGMDDFWQIWKEVFWLRTSYFHNPARSE